jgi:hypothetical protein
VELASFFSSVDGTVAVASIGIATLAAAAWLVWDPKIRATTRDLRRIRKHFEESAPDGRAAIKDAATKTKDVNIKSVLAEVQSGLFELPGDLGVKTYSLRFYQDIWTPRALLARRVNLALYEAAPNILIGIGLLLTFLFLAIALANVIPALEPNTPSEGIKEAIKGLLQNAAGKFLTSISGMACSLLWTYGSKRSLEMLEDEIEALCVSMRTHVEDTGSEAAISAQIALMSEILTENREQVGQLKRFETDFAVAIGKALGSQMQPAFEQLTASITKALDALTNKIGSMNEDALKKMIEDFRKAIQDASGAEMAEFKKALLEIAKEIKDAAGNLKTAGQGAGESLNGAFQGARDAAALLEQAMVTAKATVNDVDESIERAATEGRQGLANLQQIMTRIAETTLRVGELVAEVKAASSEFQKAATSAANATGNLERVVESQNSIVNTVAQTAVTLGSSLTNANNEFKESAKTMAETTKEMSDGVTNYSTKVAELHERLDDELGKAIGSLNSTISELVDGLDDFLEAINNRRG